MALRKSFGLELAAIVVSVLLAIGAESWWQDRQDALRPSAAPAGWNGTWGPSPWAPEFSVSDAEGREILARLRAHPEARSRIEGMVRVQGNQYGVLTLIRERALETLAEVERASSKP